MNLPLTGQAMEALKATDPFLRGAKPVSKSSISPDMAAWARAEDVDVGGNGAKLVSPYSQSAWVYIAVSILAKHVAQIPFRVSRVGGGGATRVRSLRASHQPEHRKAVRKALNADILESGDVVDLFKRPHPTMNGEMFWEMVITWFALRGEFFILPLDGADGVVDLSERRPDVRRMITLPTELFWHIVTGYELTAWRYTGSPLLTPIPSEVLLPDEVIHHRSPNPYLYWRGMSPLIVAMLPAQSDYAGEQYQKGLWVNNADTGVIVTTDQILTDDQRKSVEVALRERKRKAGTADRPLFLFGGAKVEKPMLSMLDMQFLETRKFLRSEIFSIFSVPEPLAGFTSDLNDGGAGGSLDAVKGSFVESTIGSLCMSLENAMDKIVKVFGDDLVGWFDIDSLPIMQAQRRARWDTASKMFSMSVPMDDINSVLDLGLPDRPWYKEGYLPFNLQSVSQPPEPMPSEQPAEETEDDGEKSNPFERMGKLMSALRSQPADLPPQIKSATANLWRKRMQFRQAHVNLFKGKIGKVLNVFRKKTLAKLEEVHLEKSAGRMNWDAKNLVDIVFDRHGFSDALNSELHSPVSSLLQAAGENMLSEIGYDDPWKYPPKQVLEYINGRKLKIVGIGESVRNELNTTLSEGVEAGETHLELAARVKEKFSDLTDGKAKTVARTEVNTATCRAGFVAMRDVGIEYKSWLGSHGPHAREGHQSVEDATVDEPIAVTELFDVPNELGIVSR
jgi:HK97 family phage portal protein